MKTLIIIILCIVPSAAYCKYRPIDIKKEIENANFVGEIRFVGYDSIKVSKYSDGFHIVETDSLTGKEVRVENKDSVWIMSKIYYQQLGTDNDSIYSAEIYINYSWGKYHERPNSLPKETVSNGYWPKLNEDCLLIINSSNKVSVFALIESGDYIIWDPYFNSSWNSVFLFNDHFECYPTNGKNSLNSEEFKHVAEFNKMNTASQYHCKIEKSVLWDKLLIERP